MRGKRNLAILADLSQHHGDGQAIKPARVQPEALGLPPYGPGGWTATTGAAPP